ncbi:hypothetical protein KC727_03165 [Candidatus Kaiserbacteria bacterium]|nr:hypothetical protein [Candidatus Kaiserbacteria bacterium]
MNLQQAAERLVHRHVDTGVITKVSESDDYYSISLEGSGFGIAKPVDRTPEVGQTVTLYLFQGSRIQGVDLDGEPLFFKSKDDLEVERQKELKRIEAEKAERKIKFFAELENPDSDFNRRLHRLPKVFQQRFKKFFRLGEDFWDLAWYELVACETALKIAYACKSWQGIRRFYGMTWDEQKALIPSMDDGMSGNQFGFACSVANVYLRNPKLVRKVRGAMSPLTGSKPYIGR